MTHRQACAGLLLVVVLMTGCGSTMRDPGPFYSATIDKLNPQGRSLVMTVREVQRDGPVSEVVVVYTSGGSVGSSLFIMKCLCAMAEARGASHFVILREWDEPGGYHYRVGFTDDGGIDPRTVFPGPHDEKAPLQVLSVAQFAPLLKQH